MHNITDLSPLQGWLERIHDYVNQKDILKARFASLILPLFEAWELFGVLKKICFSAYRTPAESSSQLVDKAKILAFNIIFAGQNGFIDPENNYQFHVQCGLAYPKEESEKEGRLIPDNDSQTPIEPPQQGLEQIKEKTSDPSEQKSLSKEIMTENPPSASSSTVEEGSHRKFKETLQVLKPAPSISSFHRRMKSRREFESMKELSSLSQELKGEEPPSLTEEGKSPTNLMTDKASFVHETAAQPSLTQSQLKAIELLTQRPMRQKESWRVKNQQIQFNLSTTFSIDPSIIDILAQANESGFLSSLNFDQTFTLHHNLKIIEKYLGTLKSRHFDQLLAICNSVQEQLVTKWILDDYQHGKFYLNCQKIISKIEAFIREGKGCANDEQDRLFEESSSQSISELFECWNCVNASVKINKFDLTIYDYYEILKTYLQLLPNPIQKLWEPLKRATSIDEWQQALASLPQEDRDLITGLVALLKESHVRIWSNALDEMLVATESLFTYACPAPDLLRPVSFVKLLMKIY